MTIAATTSSALAYFLTVRRNAPAAAPTPAQRQAGDRLEASASELQRAIEARGYLGQTLESTVEDQKVQAKERLERAKDRLATLKRWGFDPEVVARVAAQLAREVGAAGQQFASAASADGGISFVSASAEVYVAAGQQPSPDNAAILQAYRSVMESGRRTAGLSQSDRNTIEAFKAMARQLEQLLEKALRELRQKKSLQGAANEVEKAKSAIEGTVSALDGVASGVFAQAGSFSITI